LFPDAVGLGFREGSSDPVGQPQFRAERQVANPLEKPAQAGYLVHQWQSCRDKLMMRNRWRCDGPQSRPATLIKID
jgi:hypothetical protein